MTSLYKELSSLTSDEILEISRVAKESIFEAAAVFRISKFTAWSLTFDYELNKWIK